MSSTKHFVMASALAAAIITGPTSSTSAHSIDACIDDVREFCDTVHGAGTPEALACRQQGAIQCPIHRHPGNPPEQLDPNISADPGHQLFKKKKSFRVRRR